MRNLSQKRAEFALNKVLESKNIDKFKSFAASAPTQILQNGFGQALAFWTAKRDKDPKFKQLLSIVKEWLEKNKFLQETNSYEEFILKITQIQQNEYLSIQKETLYLLEWVKKYADAFCK